MRLIFACNRQSEFDPKVVNNTQIHHNIRVLHVFTSLKTFEIETIYKDETIDPYSCELK
jgi:hypothetical protein